MNPKFSVSVIIDAIDKVSGPTKIINEKLKKATQSVKGLNRSMSFKSQMPKTFESFTSLGKNLKGLGNASGARELNQAASKISGATRSLGLGLKSLATIATGSGLAIGGISFGAVSILKDMNQEGIKLKNTSEELGITTQSLQAYQFAASQAGVSTETMQSALSSLGKSAVDASLGTGNVMRVFEALGIRVMDKTGQKIKKVDALFLETSEKLSKLKNSALKRQITSQILGGDAISPLLNQGPDKIKSSLKNALQIDFFIDENQVKQSEKLNESLTILSYTLKSIRNIIGAELLPVFTQTLGEFSQYITSNRDEIRSFFKDFASGIPEAFKSAKAAFETLKSVLSPILSGIKMLSDTFGAFNLILGLTAVKVLGSILPAVLQLGGAVLTLSRALFATPLGLLITGLFAVLRVSRFVIQNFEKLSQIFDSVFRSPLDQLGKFKTLLATLGKSVISTDWATQGLDADLEKRKQENALTLPNDQKLFFTKLKLNLDRPENKFSQRPTVSGQKSDSKQDGSQVVIRFQNAPQGMRVQSQKGNVKTDVHMGLSMLGIGS